MGVAILTDGQKVLWKIGVDKRINEATAQGHGLWAKIKRSFYDMGQNVRFLIYRLTAYKLRALEIPKHENCSSLTASVDSCGFETLPQFGPNWLHRQMNVNETAEVAPSHYGMVPEVYGPPLKPGDPIPDYSVILCLSWDKIDFGLTETLKRLVKLSPKHWNIFSDVFRDAIRLTQRDILGHDAPYWRATHVMRKWYGKELMKIVSQEEVAKVKAITQNELWRGMDGPEPKYIVLPPRFLA